MIDKLAILGSGLWSLKWVIAFYLGAILLIYLNRSKFQIEAKIIAIYRTKWGLKWMDHLGTKARRFIQIYGYIGIVLGIIGMIF